MDLFMSQFHFLRPWAWICLFLLFFIIYLMRKAHNAGGAWQKICSPELLKYLQVGEAQNKPFQGAVWVTGLAGLLAITALAGPVWQQQPQVMYREASALVVALDLSRSMDAGDVKPSRLVRAKQKLSDLLSMRTEGQTALIAFAGTAYVVTPLTDDRETVLAQLEGLTTDIMPKQGGDLDDAINKALDLFKQASVKHGELLFLTDSNDFSEAVVQKLKNAGHAISVIGVGTLQGAPIPKAKGGFFTDAKGNIVIPSLDESRLQHLAALGGGVYHNLSLSNADIEPILKRLNPTLIDKIHGEDKTTSAATHDAWHEEGPWLLLALIPLALLGFRRGLLIIVVCIGVQVKPVEASSWDDMWQSKNHQAETLMQEKKYKEAGDKFQNPSWKMAAHYRDENYKAVLQDFDGISKPSMDDMYNKANALAKLGRLDDAIEAYKAVLAINSKNKDAQANKALLEKIKREQKEKDQQSKDQQSKDQQSKDQQSKDQKSKDQKSKDQQSKDQQSKDQKSKDQPSKDQKSKDQKSKDQKSKDQQSKDQKSKDQQSKDQQSKDQQSKDQQSKDQKSKDQKSKDQKSKDQKSKEKKAKQNELTEKEVKKIEATQAFEQALRRIPDDPGGLLRRKFLYQYQQQGGAPVSKDGKAW